jgi:hypothetical protein
MTSPPPPSAAPGAQPSSSLLQAALDQAKQSKDALASLRTNADVTSKVLAGIGTTAATALGVTKIADVFPQPPGWGLVVVASFVIMIMGLVAALAAVLWLASRLWKVSDTLPSSSDPLEMKQLAGLEQDEERIVRRVYDEKAASEGVPTLLAYEARGLRFERVASKMDADDEALSQGAQAMLDRALIIEADVAATQARATYLVGRKRAAKAFTDKYALGIGALFVSGLIMASFTDSYLAARTTTQTARVTLAKNCADATTAAHTAMILPKRGLQIIDTMDCSGVLPASLNSAVSTSSGSQSQESPANAPSKRSHSSGTG